MSDNCQYQHLLIDQYIKMVLQKLQQSPKQSQIFKLPFTIYVQSKKIFKQDSQIVSYLIKRIKEIFYLKEFKNESSSCSDERALVYVNLLFSMKNHKIVILSQIIVRIVLLALSIQIGEKDSKTFRFKFSRLIQDLKIELILSPQSISDLIIKELQSMAESFQSLQYYEELRSIFQKLQVNKVVKWLQSSIEQKRNKYQNKAQTILPYKLESNSKINPIEQINSTQPTPSMDKKVEVQSKAIEGKGHSQNKMDKKQARKNSPQNQRRISTIVLANRLRKSTGIPSTRFSAKYTFKSSKKQSEQNEVVYEQETELECISIHKNQRYQYNQNSNMHNQIEYSKEQQENSLILCPATPPKTNRKYILE